MNTENTEHTLDQVKLRRACDAAMTEATSASVFHGNFHSPHEGFAVLLEEVDELKAHVWMRAPDHKAMRREALQVAAVAMRFAAHWGD